MANVDFGKYKRIVQYFWDPQPANDQAPRSSIWCLGQEYKAYEAAKTDTPKRKDHGESSINTSPVIIQSATPPDSHPGSVDSTVAHDDSGGEEDGWPSAFLDDFEAKIWLTYRSDFPTIAKSQDPKAWSSMSLSVRLRSSLVDQSGFTSDTGWGCMIRSGQSLLANSLLLIRLGRGWRRGSSPEEERKLLSLFADDPKAPFSIHKFVECGASVCGKHPGEWFGPSATARCIQDLTNEHAPSELRVYATGDGPDVYEDAFTKVARTDGKFNPTLILVGTRLGLEKITPVYWEALKHTLQMPQSIGIAGGRPSSSHYFIGVQGQHFFYLDPHHTRPALPLPADLNDYTQEDIDSCHTRRLRRLPISEVDPSMLIAFLIQSEEDWNKWKKTVNEVQGKKIVHIADKDPSATYSMGVEREGAIDEVETFDDDDDM